MHAISALVAAAIITIGVRVYVWLYPTFPPHDRLPLLKWLMTWPLVAIVIGAAPGEPAETLLRALSA